MKLATSIYLYFLIGFFPLVFSPDGLSDIFLTKRIFFYSVTLLYLLAVFILCIVFQKMPRFNAASVFAVIYLVVTAISAVTSSSFPKTVFGVSRHEGLFTIFLYVLIFIAVSSFGSISKGHVYTLIGSSAIFGTVCALQLQGLNPFGLYPNGYTYFDGGVRYSGSYIGTIGNADFVGAYLCIVIPALFYILLRTRIKFRILAVIPLALLLYTVSKISVMAALVGLCAGTVVAIPIILKLKKRSSLIYSLSILSLGVMTLAFLREYDTGSGFLHEIHEILNGRISDEFGSNRIRIWKDVVSVIPEAPILGKGPDTMLLERFEKFSTFYPALNKTLTSTIDTAHNEYLNVLYHQGILGLAAYLLTVFFSLKNAFRSRSALSRALCISLAAYLVQAFFGISICIVSPLFWTALALASKKPPISEALYF